LKNLEAVSIKFENLSKKKEFSFSTFFLRIYFSRKNVSCKRNSFSKMIGSRNYLKKLCSSKIFSEKFFYKGRKKFYILIRNIR